MIPQANNDFETSNDSGPLRRLTPTAIDLVNPFASSLGQDALSDDLRIPHNPQLTIDPPTTLVLAPVSESCHPERSWVKITRSVHDSELERWARCMRPAT